MSSAAIHCVATDSEPKRQLARSEAKYRGLLEAAPDAMVVVDEGGSIVLVDSAPGDAGLADRAHKIVSQAGMLGLTRMSDCARALEDACRSGAGAAIALRRCRAAAGDVRRYAMAAAEAPQTGIRAG